MEKNTHSQSIIVPFIKVRHINASSIDIHARLYGMKFSKHDLDTPSNQTVLMNKWSIFFLALAILSGLFAFGVIAGVAIASISYIVFFISMGLFALFMLFSKRPRKSREQKESKL